MKLLAAALLVLVLVLPVRAEAPGVKIVVDGIPLKPDVPARIIDGRTMVPARFVAEALGAWVNWNPATQTVEVDSMPWAKLQVTGRPEFKAALQRALDFIREKAPDTYRDVTKAVHLVIEGYTNDPSAIAEAIPEKRALVVNWGRYANDPDIHRHLITTLVHETEHVHQYLRDPKAWYKSSLEQLEGEALEAEIAFWKKVGGAEDFLRRLEARRGTRWWETR